MYVISAVSCNAVQRSDQFSIHTCSVIHRVTHVVFITAEETKSVCLSSRERNSEGSG